MGRIFWFVAIHMTICRNLLWERHGPPDKAVSFLFSRCSFSDSFFHLQVFYNLSTWRAPPSAPPSLPAWVSCTQPAKLWKVVLTCLSQRSVKGRQRRRLSGNQHGSGICQGFVPHFKEVLCRYSFLQFVWFFCMKFNQEAYHVNEKHYAY